MLVCVSGGRWALVPANCLPARGAPAGPILPSAQGRGAPGSVPKVCGLNVQTDTCPATQGTAGSRWPPAGRPLLSFPTLLEAAELLGQADSGPGLPRLSHVCPMRQGSSFSYSWWPCLSLPRRTQPFAKREIFTGGSAASLRWGPGPSGRAWLWVPPTRFPSHAA